VTGFYKFSERFFQGRSFHPNLKRRLEIYDLKNSVIGNEMGKYNCIKLDYRILFRSASI
jgi:hypothetical protein